MRGLEDGLTSFKLIRAVCLSLPPGTHQSAAQSQEEVGCLTVSFLGSLHRCNSHLAPRWGLPPWILCCGWEGQPTSISLEDFCVQSHAHGSSRKETDTEKKGYFLRVYASHYMLIQAHSIFCFL